MLLVKKIKIYLKTKDKERLLNQSELCRQLYNLALEQRIMAWKDCRKSLSVYDQKKELPEFKKAFMEFQEVYNKYLSSALFRLDDAFKGFFRRIKKNEPGRKGFPRFRGRNYFFTLECPAMYIRILSRRRVKLPQNITIKLAEDIPDNFKNICITKNEEGWFITFPYEQEESELSSDDRTLAIDLGISKLVTGVNDDGEFVETSHRKPSKKEMRRLDNIRSKRDKCEKGSRRWNFLSKVYRRELKRWNNRAMDHLHKVSFFLCKGRTERSLVIGDLKPKEMVSKIRGLNRLVQNEWRLYQFIKLLEYKARKFGKLLFKVNERGTSKTCSKCGSIKAMPLSQRTYSCSNCGLVMDRDRNSAVNIWQNVRGLRLWDIPGVLASARNLLCFTT